MDQADETELIRHGRQLATYGLLGEKFAVRGQSMDSDICSTPLVPTFP
jgi:hypothetical protein